MTTRIRTFALLALLAACQVPNPVVVQPAFTTASALLERNPTDIAVLPVEDGTQDHQVARLCEAMRQVVERGLVDRLYTPLKTRIVDASMGRDEPAKAETNLSPSYLKRVAGKAQEDAVLAVRIDRWDESQMLVDDRVRFQVSAALAGSDGLLLWQGNLSGTVKAGGEGAAPRDREAMARSCAELAMTELLKHLPQRQP